MSNILEIHEQFVLEEDQLVKRTEVKPTKIKRMTRPSFREWPFLDTSCTIVQVMLIIQTLENYL
ncbi:hypothetical protein Elgi_55100 [Paenibacillus elgii]|nr:hypothetical protein Elgi_55100 [Paenibacillus elgii]